MAAPSGPSRGRKRDADATRAALLEAARELFGRHGYEAVTLRDIGERAGADGSLVARYFGSKAAPYRSAVTEESREGAASPEPADLASFTAYALDRADRRGAPEARASAAEEMRARLVAPLAARLAGEGAEDPDARAEVLVSCLAGVIALRSSGLFPHLATLSPETIGAMLESAALAQAPETAG
ncbi:TetR/AcrR family transcriptional regulator [Streptomyces albidoflavus]|uniref:TetR/AcrR family transcriptional regulator n=1 Tax=Streptomyces albidoflavus TaxID=1886 RepID=UPI0004C483E0|nr:TetR/AcrR family transcriptional regulator [Streptomyces albidoflavus]